MGVRRRAAPLPRRGWKKTSILKTQKKNFFNKNTNVILLREMIFEGKWAFRGNGLEAKCPLKEMGFEGKCPLRGSGF